MSLPRDRRLFLVTVGILVAMLSAPPASAAAPERDLPPQEVMGDFTLPAGEYCDFDVDVTFVGKQGAIVFDDRVMVLSPGMRATLTTNDESITIPITGPGRVVEEFNPDGSGTVTVHQRGRGCMPTQERCTWRPDTSS